MTGYVVWGVPNQVELPSLRRGVLGLWVDLLFKDVIETRGPWPVTAGVTQEKQDESSHGSNVQLVY